MERSREEGNVPISREVSSLAGLGAGLIVLWMSSGATTGLAKILRNLIAASGTIDLSGSGLGLLFEALAVPVATVLAPVMGAALAAVIAATLLQSGLALNIKALTPDLSRISPARGLKRIFGPTNVVEAIKSVVKLVAFGLVIQHIVMATVPDLKQSSVWTAGLIGAHLAHLLFKAVLLLLAVQIVIAGADVVWVRYHRGQELRMSRQDLRDEHKDSEGNPHVKGRLRALRRARARQRMMQAVPKATVVLTNPTHYAVALLYEQGSKQAPKVVAKGVDEVAARIRELARNSRVPVIPNPPLARTLFTVPLDQEVPREQFQAVAAIIAYVWRLDQRRRPAIT